MSEQIFPKKGELDFLCALIGGSHLYGLNNAASDIDYRGIYMTNSLVSLMGFNKDECQGVSNEQGDDYNYFELCRFMQLCRKSNTNVMEMLFAPDQAFLYNTWLFEQIRSNKLKFVDSAQLLKSCRGYVQSESRLALGERTGKLGGKRKNNLDIYGFSPKNVVQLIRIVAATRHFMATGEYPIKIKDHDQKLHDLCMKIKNTPENFSVDEIKELVQDCNTQIMQIEDKVNIKFDTELAAEICFDYYQLKFKK